VYFLALVTSYLALSAMKSAINNSPSQLLETWQQAWPRALEIWSKYTRLHDPLLCVHQIDAAKEGLSGSFAMIRLLDKSVVVDLETVTKLGLQDYAVEVLAHEIGHHILAPATVSDQFRLLARIRKALPTLERHAPMLANLYTDLLINDRLKRAHGLRIEAIYERIYATNAAQPQHGANQVWMLYMGIYEHLWQLTQGSLGGPTASNEHKSIAGDAWLGARLIRVYANDWMDAAGRFASLLLPYLVDDEQFANQMRYLHDTENAGRGCDPSGGIDRENNEESGVLHPADDPLITGESARPRSSAGNLAGHSQGQQREPFEYGELLKAMGLRLDNHEIAVRYYREMARPHLVRFPTRLANQSKEPQLEDLDPWELGDPIDDVDWLQSLTQSPRPIPGVSLVKRHYGQEIVQHRDKQPVDLDMYVDSSGSMPNPMVNLSYPALAGAVIALSALRAGSKVQVTLWSGTDQFMHTQGFVRDENQILRVLTSFFGGGTAFPIHRLRDTYAARKATDRPVHILMISDDGIDTMFAADERGNSGWDISAQALSKARGGGTMALNIPSDWVGSNNHWAQQSFKDIKRARDEQAWTVAPVADLKDLLGFAQTFSRTHYGQSIPVANPREPA
jgi:hypothetical protein